MSFLQAIDVLGLELTATQSEVRARYIKLAKQYHPDCNNDSVDAKINMQEINEAKRVLDECFAAQQREAERRKEAQNQEWQRQQYAKYQEETAEDAEIAARRARAEAAAKKAAAEEEKRQKQAEAERQEFVKQQAERQRAEAAARRARAEAEKKAREDEIRRIAAEAAKKAAAEKAAKEAAEKAMRDAAEAERIKKSNEDFLRQQAEVRRQAQEEEKQRKAEEAEMFERKKQRDAAFKNASKSPFELEMEARIQRENSIREHLEYLEQMARNANSILVRETSAMIDLKYMVPRPKDYKSQLAMKKKCIDLAKRHLKLVQERLDNAKKLASRGRLDPVVEQAAWDVKMKKKSTVYNRPQFNANDHHNQNQGTVNNAGVHAAFGARPAAQPQQEQCQAAFGAQQAAFVGEREQVAGQDKVREEKAKAKMKKMTLDDLFKNLSWCQKNGKLSQKQNDEVTKILKTIKTAKSLSRIAYTGVAGTVLAAMVAFLGDMVQSLDPEIIQMIAGASMTGLGAAAMGVIYWAERKSKLAFATAGTFFRFTSGHQRG